MRKKRYRMMCTYETVCTNFIPVMAENPDEAIAETKREFAEWNRKWEKDGGSPKNLLRVDILDVED